MSISLPGFTEQLRQLIALPSVSSTTPSWDMSNLPVIELLADWLSQLQFRTEIIPVEPAGQDAPRKANLIATLGEGPGGLVLAGHTDTVPYNAERWQQDPFQLEDKDHKFYGLGATDMKGFFPVAIAAVQALLDHDFRQPLIILATADEESSMNGARQLAALGRPKARYAVIGEPTGMRPIHMHKGIMLETVVIQGEAGHSSNPNLGNNALEAMHEVLGTLLDYRQILQSQYHNPGFTIPSPTLNLGCIHGGDNPNRICGHCELQFDLRPLPGMEIEELRAEIRRRLNLIAEQRQIGIDLVSQVPGLEPFEQSLDSPLVEVVSSLSGYSPESVAFATEAPLLQSLGMDTVVMGPGSINQAHQPNEYIEHNQIEPAITILMALIRRFCL